MKTTETCKPSLSEKLVNLYPFAMAALLSGASLLWSGTIAWRGLQNWSILSTGQALFMFAPLVAVSIMVFLLWFGFWFISRYPFLQDKKSS